ncbi:MAG: phytanoyl-CoA dioxygenase family protein, partial [Chthonomonadales bacterium]
MADKLTDKAKIASYQKEGWVIENIFDSAEIGEFTLTFADVLKLQMRKLRLEITGDINEDVKTLNARSSVAMTETMGICRNTSAGHKLAANPKLNGVSAGLLEGDTNLDRRLVISGPSFFVNIPSSNERKYTWHSEQNWYPKRRNFLNVWCPIVVDRVDNNSMAVMTGSHDTDWFYFSEYTGYDGTFDEKANVQYEIPESFLGKYKSEVPPVAIGQALFFNGKLVH